MMAFRQKSVIPTWAFLVSSALFLLAAFIAFLHPVSTWGIVTFASSTTCIVFGSALCFTAWRSYKGRIPDIPADRLTPGYLRNLKIFAILTALACGSATSVVLVELILERSIPPTSALQGAFIKAACMTMLVANYFGAREKMTGPMESGEIMVGRRQPTA